MNNLRMLVLLLALGVMSAFAALQFTNVTYWAVNATAPPVEKYPGADAAAYPKNIMVKWATDTNTGFNVTYIYILGYTGDITNYTNALQVCNKGSSNVNVAIRYAGLVGGSYASYVKQFVVYNPSNTGQWVGFTYTGTTFNGPVQVATLTPGGCVTLGVSVLVSGGLPSAAWSSSVGTAVPPTNYLAIYRVDIVTSQ